MANNSDISYVLGGNYSTSNASETFPLKDPIPLTRQSSFEKFISNLESNQKHLSAQSAIKIQQFWRSFQEQKEFQIKIEKLATKDVFLLKSNLNFIHNSKSFQDCQDRVMDEGFIRSMQAFLQRFYSSQLKPSRDSRLVASAILIYYYPLDILEDGYDSESISDQDHSKKVEEVSDVINASKLTVFTLNRLISAIDNINQPPIRRAISKYNESHRAYFMSLTNFSKAIDAWKVYDKQRMVQQLEFSFIQSYSLWLSTKQFHDEGSSDYGMSPPKQISNLSPSKLRTNSEQQMQKIEAAYRSIVGNNVADSRFEELAAMVEASINFKSKEHELSPPQSQPTSPTNASTISAQDVSYASQISFPAMNEETVSLSNEQQLMLTKLAQEGLNPEQIVYEVLFDPSYQLSTDVSMPSIFNKHSNDDDENLSVMETMTEKFRNRLLFLMNDRLIWSLKTSSVVDPHSDIRLGLIIPVSLSPQSNDSSQWKSSITTFESARILSIHTAQDDLSVVLSIDIQYLSDESIERNVSIHRIKLFSHPIDPTLFLSSLRDLLQRISALTPNRKDIQDKLMELVDFDLLFQMIMNRAMSIDDCLRVFYHLFVSIIRLQAPVRSDVSKHWWQEFIEDSKKLGNFDEFIELIPKFFVYASKMIDEIHRDMSNYYISTLSATMQSIGPKYLVQKFLDRLQSSSFPSSNAVPSHVTSSTGNSTSLDLTASLLFAHVQPKQTFQSTIESILETGWTFVIPTSTNVTVSGSLTIESYSDMIQNERGMKALVAYAISQLISLPIRLNTPQAKEMVLPELLVYDSSRLAEIRDIIDKISLEAVLTITSKQIIAKLGKVNVSSEQGMNELEYMHRLDVLLSNRDVDLSHITTETVRHVMNTTGVTRTTTIDNILLDDYVKKSVSEVIKANNPILQLLFKRIMKLVLRGMLGQKYNDKLSSYSLQSPGLSKNIEKLIQSISKLFNHHWNVYGTIYQMILKSSDFHDRVRLQSL